MLSSKGATVKGVRIMIVWVYDNEIPLPCNNCTS